MLGPRPLGIGVVAPHDLALDRELWQWMPDGVSLYFTRRERPAERDDELDRIRDLADVDSVARACRDLAAVDPAVTVYACTSASFVGGIDGEERLRRAMTGAGATRALTTSGALLEALAALDVRRVALAAPYGREVTALLRGFLREAGFDVRGVAHLDGLPDEAWRLSDEAVVGLADSVPRDGVDVLFLSCTNLPTYAVLPALEARYGIPVLSANLVTAWAALRRLGHRPRDRPELLFARSAGAAPPSLGRGDLTSRRDRS